MELNGNQNYHQITILSFEILWKMVNIILCWKYRILYKGFRTPFGFLTIVLGVHCLPIIRYLMKYQILIDLSPLLLYNINHTCIIGRLFALYCEVRHLLYMFKKKENESYYLFFFSFLRYVHLDIRHSSLYNWRFTKVSSDLYDARKLIFSLANKNKYKIIFIFRGLSLFFFVFFKPSHPMGQTFFYKILLSIKNKTTVLI
jgi:hypothetical protein